MKLYGLTITAKVDGKIDGSETWTYNGAPLFQSRREAERHIPYLLAHPHFIAAEVYEHIEKEAGR